MKRHSLSRALRAFYRLRPLTGLIIALPGLLLAFWAVWTSWTRLAELKAFTGSAAAIDAGLLRIQLHDLAERQLMLGARPAGRAVAASANLPVYAFELKASRLTELLSPKRPWVEGKLDYAGTRYKQTELRLRGTKYWHLKGPKKSLRVKLDKGRLIEALREFDLDSPHDPVLFGEQLILDLARRRGLLTVETGFARVSINGLDLGVFALREPVGEALLRRKARIPANVYQLEQLSADWRSAGKWEKASSYQHKEADTELADRELDRRPDLAALVASLQGDFAGYAAEQLALRDFATLDALRRLFGTEAGVRNYALTFDPYRGHWQPILTGFEGFRSELPAAQDPDPLFAALEALPAYRSLRDGILAELSAGEAAPAQVRQQGEALLASLEPDLNHDPYWQANKLLPELNGLYRSLMRPMSAERLRLALDSELETYARRVALIRQHLHPVAVNPAPQPAPQAITIGPGPVEMPLSRVFAAHQAVTVAAGTELRLGAGASLIFFGPVHFAGTAAAPIRIRPATAARWGGLVLQGPATAGSRLEHLDVAGGSRPSWQSYEFPGMINLHASHDIAIRASRFADNSGSDDLIHTAYVERLRADDVLIQAAAADGWDLEFSSAKLSGLRVVAAGDDCIDLMTDRLELRDSALIDCHGNGLSTGEASEVSVAGSLIAASGTGALAKNASRLRLAQSLLWRNQKALEIKQKSAHYPGLSAIEGQSLFEAGSETRFALDDAGRGKTEAPRLLGDYRRAPVLAGLRRRLGLSDWDGLGAWLSLQRKAAG